jgi:excinuclease ABC subunit C
MTLFDRKFGKGYLASVPTVPGVYSLYGEDDELIYVGKAKNLRRRLAQYRKAGRSKRGRKMRSLIKEAVRIAWETCESDLDACLLELRRIQALKPTRNIVGTFTFLYPMIGMVETKDHLAFCFTTSAASLPQFEYYGAFRSREACAEGFFALMRLLNYIGHPVPRRLLKLGEVPKYSYVLGFRRLPEGCAGSWRKFFAGASNEALEELVFRLLDNAGARRRRAEVQEDVEHVSAFWEREIVPLRDVIARTQYAEYPVPATERDLLFVRAGFLEKETTG